MTPPKVGDLISGKYRLVRVIGDGGMGTVFEARHEYLGTAVALKFLHPELAERQGLIARFLQEARLAASIKSPYIAHVTDIDQTSGGAAYLVMELLEGHSLQAILERDHKLSLETALDYTLQILAGLEAAHTVGVVHRDLKPDNVFVVGTPHGPLVKLLDFGIAKLRSSKELPIGLTRPGAMMGTPEYMAPEQAYSADTVDARADVYAVGAMLYEMLLGVRPAPGDNPQHIAAFVLGNKVPFLSQVDANLPEGLARAVHRAMSPMVSGRFSSVAELRQALLPFCTSLSVAGRFAIGAGAAPPASPGVAPTLPPGEGPTSPDVAIPAAMQDARRAAVAGWARTQAPEVGALPGPLPGPPAASAPPPPVPPAYGSPALGAGSYALPTPQARSAQSQHGRARAGRRASLWLLLGTIGLAIAVVAIALATAKTTSDDSAASGAAGTPPAPSGGALPGVAPTATAEPDKPVVIAPPLQPNNAPVVTHPAPAKLPSPSRAADAGIASTADAGTAAPAPGLPQFPFPFPSAINLPPFPSSITIPTAIPMPSGFPPFNLPGFPPRAAPVPSASH